MIGRSNEGAIAMRRFEKKLDFEPWPKGHRPLKIHSAS